MIDSSEILDLSDDDFPERPNDDHHQQVAVLSLGHPLLPGRQPKPSASSQISAQDIAEMTLKEELIANSLLDSDYKDVKIGFEELCPVCGDKVSGYHYGLLTCESCKGFFKRTVQNKKVYSCVDNRNCQIDKSQRKRCPYCRFQKCLSVGMKLEAVRSDRMRGGRNKFGPMYKRDRALKQQAARQAHVFQGSCGDIPLLANGMMTGGIPGSPEDIKPDPVFLQASLSLYTGTASTTSNIIPGIIPGLNCLSLTAAAPSSSSSVAMPAGDCSPPPTHSHHVLHASHQPSHHSQVPSSTSPQSFTQSCGHTSSLIVPQPHSPKTHYPQHHHHNNNQQQHHTGNGHLHHGSTSPNGHHHQHHQAFPHTQALSEFHMSQNQLHSQTRNNNINNNTFGSSTHDNDPSYSTSSPVHPKMIDVLRSFQGPMVTGLSERSILSPLIAEIKSTMVDESEVKQKMLTFMQNELLHMDVNASPEQFLPVLCRMVDQLLFLMVEWARNSSFFKEIKVEDQMKLLHNSWSEILILDFIFRQVHNVWGKEIVLPNGDVFGLEILDSLGLGDVKAKVFELIKKGRELKIDFNEYMCLKFLIMLNPDVSSLENRVYIEQCQEKVNAALFEYCLLVYPDMADRFSQLLMRLPEIRLISIHIEEFLYFKHLSNEVPDQTLLTEMLHAKRRG